MSNIDFLQKMEGPCKDLQYLYGIPWQFVLAQAALETGWGTSSLFRDAKNCFGIKALRDWNGPTLNVVTKENLHGRWVSEIVKFRKYTDLKSGLLDYVKFLQTPRYKLFWKQISVVDNWKLPELGQLAEILQNAGYATDPNYARQIVEVIKDNGWAE